MRGSEVLGRGTEVLGGRHDSRRGDGGGGFPDDAGPAGSDAAAGAAAGADRFLDEQMFEEDVRAVVAMMRPHRRERLMGWSEYRTGGANYRATISWDRSFERAPQSHDERRLAVPRLTDVLESIIVGSIKDHAGLSAADEFEVYRGVVRELYRRLGEMQSRYE